MQRLGPTLLALLFLTAPLARAQEDNPFLREGYEPQEAGETLDFEVVSVMRQELMVVARDVESGDEFRFRMPAQSFQGQEFTADLSAAPAGGKVAVQGKPNAKLDKLVLEAPLGLSRSGGDASGGRRPGYRPRSPEAAGKPPRRPGDKSGDRYGFGRQKPGGGGEMQYRIESFDPQEWILTARGSDGSTVRLAVDPEAFVGFRFRAPVRSLRRGEGFAILALNQEPIENCCTVVGDGPRH